MRKNYLLNSVCIKLLIEHSTICLIPEYIGPACTFYMHAMCCRESGLGPRSDGDGEVSELTAPIGE